MPSRVSTAAFKAGHQQKKREIFGRDQLENVGGLQATLKLTELQTFDEDDEEQEDYEDEPYKQFSKADCSSPKAKAEVSSASGTGGDEDSDPKSLKRMDSKSKAQIMAEHRRRSVIKHASPRR